MNDYERVARVIRFLGEGYAEQPELAVLARHAGLSPFHFHRLFSSWAGVTPKDFLQCLTVSHAKRRLREGDSTLQAALESGLSGPGRLHDLCVSLEAASPGEWKSGGAGWTLQAGFADSPFGRCLVAESPRGICHLSFVDEPGPDAAWAAFQAEWPRAVVRRADRRARELAERVFQTGRVAPGAAPLRAYVRGSAFQVRVWRALLRIPSGLTTTYGRLAEALGQSTAARAVGGAVARNSLAYLIPCHRVIRETGVVGDYRWGRVRKQAMLAWESAASPAC